MKPSNQKHRRVFGNLQNQQKKREFTGNDVGPISLLRVGIYALVCLISGTVVGLGMFGAAPANATAGINQQMSFQGKIVTSTGQNIPDGTYNMEFRIYTGCTNEPASSTGCTAVWSEDHLTNNSQGVTFTSGTYQVNLGAICAFTTSTCENNSNTAVDWNSYPLYLSLQIGNTSNCSPNNPGSAAFTADCGGDGVMNPFVLLTSTPYAFNSNELGGLTASQYGQLAASQTWTGANTIQDSATNAFVVQDASSHALLSVNTSGDIVGIGATGGTAVASTVNVGTSTGAAQTVTAGSTASSSTTTVQGGTGGVAITTGAGSGTTGSISITTGNSSAGTSGSITIDAGTNVPSGTLIEAKTFESSTESMTCWFGACSAVAQSTAQAHGGTHSLAMTESGGGTWGMAENYPGVASVTPGHSYAITAWVRGTTAESVDAEVVWAGVSTSDLGDVTDSTSAWTEYSGTFVAPAGATNVYFAFQGAGGGTTDYFDDMTLTDISTTNTPAINIGTSNAEAISIGNTSQSAATTLKGGAGGVDIVAGTGAAVNIGTSSNNTVTIGNSSTTGPVMMQGNGISQTITGDSSTPTDIIKTSTNSTSAFQVQDASGDKVLDADTANGRVGIGTATPSTLLDVETSTSSVTTPQLTVNQSGTGDVSVQLQTTTQPWYLGVASANSSNFEITSKAADVSATSTTFGDTTAETNPDNSATGYQLCSKYTSGGSGTLNVTSMSVYIGSAADAAPNNLFQVALYTDSSGPHTLIAHSSSATVLGNSWNTVPITATISGATPYWLCYQKNASNASLSEITRNLSGSGAYNTTGGVSFGSWGSTFPASSTDFDGYAIYATYNTGGAYNTFGSALMSISSIGQTTFENSTNSTTAFQVQNASNNSVLTADTSNGLVALGSSNHVNGELVLNNSSNANTVAVVSGVTSSSYTLTMPAAGATGSQCLQSTSGSTAASTTLQFGSCGSGSGNPNSPITLVNATPWESDNSSSVSSGTLSDAPTKLGDLVLLSITPEATGSSVASVSGGGVTSWTKINASASASTADPVELWMGQVTATGSGTVSVTFSGTVSGGYEIEGQEFTISNASAATSWGVVNNGVNRVTTNTNTLAFPTLSSDSQLYEAYVGYGWVANSSTAGSTSGFTYHVTGRGNLLTWDTGLSSSNSYSPTGNQPTAGATNATAAIISATNGASGSGSYINNATAAQSGNLNVQAATSGTVAGVLEANAAGSGDILDLLNGSGATVGSVGSTGNLMVKPSTDSSTAFTVQNHDGTITVLAVDTNNKKLTVNGGSIPLTLNVSTATNEDGILFQANGTPKGEFGISGSAGQIINQSAAGDLNVKSASGNIYLAAGGSSEQFKLDTSGNATFMSNAGSATAFQVYDNGFNPLFNVDTLHETVNVGSTATTSNAVAVTANSLTTGSGVNIATTSAVQTAGSLLNVSNTATLATGGGSTTGSLVNVSRALTANISGGTGTPTLDHGSTFATYPAATSQTDSFTVNSGHSNYYMVVGVFDDLGQPAPTVTYAGVSMGTPILSGGIGTGTTGVYLYGLKAPATGTNNLVISGGSGEWSVAAEDWYNVNQTTPYANAKSAKGNTTMTAQSVTSVSGDVVTDFLAETTPTVTANAGQTQADMSANLTMTYGPGTVSQSYEQAAGSSVSMKWNSPTYWGWDAIDLKGATGTGSENVTGAVATFSDNCTTTSGACNDTGSVLQVNQQYSGASGAALLVQNAGSGMALQIQNGSGNNLFRVDTANSLVTIGSGATGEATPALLVLDSGTSASDPTEVNGAMYYNSSMGLFRCGQGGVWRNCVSSVHSWAFSQSSTGTLVAASTSTYYTYPGSGTLSFTKAASGTNLVVHIDINPFASATGLVTNIFVDVDSAATPVQCGQITFNTATTHFDGSCTVILTGISSGSHSAKIEVTNNSTTTTLNAGNGWQDMSIQETD